MNMSDAMFEEIDESEVVGRVRGKKKLPKWEPILSWDKPALTDEFWNVRGYGQPTEQDFEEMAEEKEESLRIQHARIDAQLKLLGVRIATVNAVRNQKEVRIKL
jgi:hypothetical protein